LSFLINFVLSTGHLLSQVVAPTLLIVGGNDDIVIGLNQIALNSLASKGTWIGK
jgi:hypothetical protein